jgi:predicted dehydrogenase
MSTPVSFSIIGGAGWRAAFFLRVVQALPERFTVSGVVARDPEKARALSEEWGVRTFPSADDLLAANAAGEFAVVSVPWPVTPVLTEDLTDRGVPVLAETPPAPDVDGLVALWERVGRRAGANVQVAEQYPYQPFHAARIAVAQSGRLGMVSQAQASVAHGYHGIAILRALLGVGFAEARITARKFRAPHVAGATRTGPPTEEKVETESQTLAWLEFGGGDKLGVFDFTGSQYFSYTRGPRLLARGDRGEIANLTVRRLPAFDAPVEMELVRRDAGHAGNLEGYHHQGITLGEEWVYRNPFAPARLADDEIAVATCLDRMAASVRGEGPGGYSLADASQDHYLSILMDRAATSGETVRAERMPWADTAL